MCSHSKEQLIRNIDRNKRSKNNNKKKTFSFVPFEMQMGEMGNEIESVEESDEQQRKMMSMQLD